MAEPDETPRPTGSGILDPLIGAGFFSPNMSLEEIKRRRAIAGALASRVKQVLTRALQNLLHP